MSFRSIDKYNPTPSGAIDFIHKLAANSIRWVEKQKVYVPVDIEEAWENTGRAPISLKWVDRNKGDWNHPNFQKEVGGQRSEERTVP